MKIKPIILAGGSGTRLWPLSREAYPKQFLKLFGEKSLFQETILRVADTEKFSSPVIVCNEQHYFICMDQLQEIQFTGAHFILEPFGRNTAPAIAIASLYIQQQENKKDEVVLVLPSDHLITENDVFISTVMNASTIAKQNYIATFGIKPSSPKTGFGYIESAEALSSDIYAVKRFIEKPDLETAEQLIQNSHYYWNSGIFLFQTDAYLTELQKNAPEMFDAVNIAYLASSKNDDYLRIDSKTFDACPSDSIDYAVMEKTQKAAVIPLPSIWNDLGCWVSVSDANQGDANGNVQRGNVLMQDSERCFLSSEGPLVAALGMKDCIVISTPDAVMVADKKYAQDVKKLVSQLQKNQSDLIKHHQKVHRPWGSYEVLVNGDQFKVKRIMVKPGAKLSLQTHEFRAEHWVVVSGTAEVVNGENTFSLTTNQSTYIPKRTKHRLSNKHDEPLWIIEVQSGDYLGEDDIIRLEDVYRRVIA